MLNRWLAYLGGTPCFRVHGKAKAEADWRVIDVYATERRDLTSRWPLAGGACTTWSDRVVAVGWDFAERVLREQFAEPASRARPVEVIGGRLRDADRRLAAGGHSFPSASEVLAHEIGHTYQAIRLPIIYLPVVGSVTLFREGEHWWNHFENDASAQGQFGGLLNGSVCARLLESVKTE